MGHQHMEGEPRGLLQADPSGELWGHALGLSQPTARLLRLSCFCPHQLLVKDHEGKGSGTGDIHSQTLPVRYAGRAFRKDP